MYTRSCEFLEMALERAKNEGNDILVELIESEIEENEICDFIVNHY